MNYVSAKVAAEFYKVSETTLRNWANEGKVKFKKTKGGHRRYLIQEEKSEKRKIIYARVSSSKQKEDLKRQVNWLKSRYPNHEVFSDIGSGIKFNRRNFQALLERVLSGNVQEVVVAEEDRLSRFGIDLIKWLFARNNVKLIVVRKNQRSPNEELAEDLIQIITVFSARYHGNRKYKNLTSKDKA